MKTQLLPAHTAAECAATVPIVVQLLRRGEIVALPTETVYGLAADAMNPAAVLKIFEAKERPHFDPLIVHVADPGEVEAVAAIPAKIRALVHSLVQRFWPGPLTLLLPRLPAIPTIVTSGLDTVAVRMSEHLLFNAVLREFGGPLAAPSANRFGRISPTNADHVREELDGRIPLIVDSGPTRHGLESTIVAVRDGKIEILRRGPITAEQLAVFGEVINRPTSSRPEAPGQLRSHYAPRTPLSLVSDSASFVLPENVRCGLLAWKSGRFDKFSVVRQLSPGQDLTEAAANLFGYLRELDQAGLDLIVAETVPEEGLGRAINDRLQRAAAT